MWIRIILVKGLGSSGEGATVVLVNWVRRCGMRSTGSDFVRVLRSSRQTGAVSLLRMAVFLVNNGGPGQALVEGEVVATKIVSVRNIISSRREAVPVGEVDQGSAKFLRQALKKAVEGRKSNFNWGRLLWLAPSGRLTGRTLSEINRRSRAFGGRGRVHGGCGGP